ncbi:hypothetical protein PoB_006301000 [Plakobranchus ocellatus]|uniref:Uncharacterized protein n=1 Tax=Plakobranchus ocellatus TaxID=259542 RepID=A0AAV4CX88_9GAST|nr:hypothetical protein PoB_006301000 [Plakobranchus ocellatus]
MVHTLAKGVVLYLHGMREGDKSIDVLIKTVHVWPSIVFPFLKVDTDFLAFDLPVLSLVPLIAFQHKEFASTWGVILPLNLRNVGPRTG